MILSKEDLVNSINADIVDNSVGAISPEDLRRSLLNIIDSVSNLTEYNTLEATNLSTKDTRTARFGVDTLSKRKAVGYSSIDNVAVGYSSLKSQIDGSQNTAVGSYALNCNMYGVDNLALGYHALSSTINGYGNIGVGSYSLNNNKEGSFNIAIGHGAGYYVERNKDYQFFVGAHPVDSDYICDNGGGQGLVPLLVGDLSSEALRLGVGVRNIHSGATLQVGGNIHPSQTNSFDLGRHDYRFKNLNLQSSLLFPNNDFVSYNSSLRKFTVSNKTDINSSLNVKNNTIIGDNVDVGGSAEIKSDLTVHGSGSIGSGLLITGHTEPTKNFAFNLGSVRDHWFNIYTYNLYSKGVARFNKFEAEEQSHFRHKTIYLASSGDMTVIDGGGAYSLHDNFNPNENIGRPEPYMLDEDLNNAGLKIGSSGIDYYRTYEFTFRSRDVSLSHLDADNVFSRSSWFSNISLSTGSGCHVETSRVIHKNKTALLTYNDGLGLYIADGKVSVTPEHNLESNMAGTGNVNFIANSGEADKYVLSLQAPSSGVNVFQRFLHKTSNYNLDNDNKEILNGFQIGYISDSELQPPNFFNEEASQNPRRFIVSSYNNSSFANRCFTLLEDGSEGYAGFSNFDYSESMLPDTMLNVRSTGNAIIRVTAENDSDTIAGIEFLGAKNCLDDGVSMHYIKNSGTLYVDTYKDAISNTALAIQDSNGHVSILNRAMSSNAMLSLGDEDHTEAHISIRESTGVPVATSGYGQLFTRSVEGLDLQSTLLSFMDGSGNLFNVDLIASSTDGSTVDKPLALDSRGNTFGGIRSPFSRTNISDSTVRNTAIGYEALSNITDGVDNTVLGYRAGKFIDSGFANVYVGSNVGESNTSKSIVIGTNISATSNSLAIGHDSKPIIEGSFNELDMKVNINKTLLVDNAISLTRSNMILGSEYDIKSNENSYYFTLSESLITIHKNTKIQGSLSFADNTSISSTNFLDDISSNSQEIINNSNRIDNSVTNLNNLQSRVDELIIEGIVEDDIRFDEIPLSFSDDPLRFYIKRHYIDNDKFTPLPENPNNSPYVRITSRDPHINIRKGDYVIAMKVNGEYRPISVTGAP